MNDQHDWYVTFFSGLALETIAPMFSEEVTRKEVDFILKATGLEPGARLLDAPCGAGRHSLELAARGFVVTGIDIAERSIDEARRRAEERKLAATFEARDMRNLPWREEFDAAFCFGNSFAYLDDEGNRAYLEAVARVLEPGGKLVLDAPMIAESIYAHYSPSSWHRLGEIIVLREARFDPHASQLMTEYTFLRGSEREVKRAYYRIYTFAELVRLLREVGFEEVADYGSLDGTPFVMGGRALYLVATRRGR